MTKDIKSISQGEYLDFLKSSNKNFFYGVENLLNILSGKWTVQILYHLCKNSSLRFGELKKLIPEITNAMLTLTLKELEKEEILVRKQFNEMPLRVEYSLTKKGEELLPVFYELEKWVVNYYSK